MICGTNFSDQGRGGTRLEGPQQPYKIPRYCIGVLYTSLTYLLGRSPLHGQLAHGSLKLRIENEKKQEIGDF